MWEVIGYVVAGGVIGAVGVVIFIIVAFSEGMKR